TRLPISRLKRADLPTFGRPTIATMGIRAGTIDADSLPRADAPIVQGDTCEERTVMNMALRMALFVLMLLFAAMSAPVYAASGHGSVFVTTLPPGATVWLDGTHKG